MKYTAWSNLIVTFLLIFISGQIKAQQTCNCIANLDTLVTKTEQNYAGYPDMIRNGLQPRYNQLVKKLRDGAQNLTDPQQCFALIKQYVIFFNDKHFDLEYTISDSTKYIYNNVTENAFKKDFALRKRDSIEGIWINPDSSLKIAVYKKDSHTYQGVILETKDAKLKPELVYYTFTKTSNGLVFDMYDWGTPDFPVKQYGNLLFVWNFNVWAKTFPGTINKDEKQQFDTWKNYNYGLDCRKINDDNVLLSIASFNRDDKIKEIIEKNDSLIRSAKHLVVDLRGNGGGNSGWAYLIPYFATRPVEQGGSYIRLSPDNISSALPGIKSSYEKPPTDPRWKKSYPPDIVEKFRKAYEEIPLSKEQFYLLPPITLYPESLSAKPEKVALIFDEFGGSSTEFFFYVSRQSSKVRRYGVRTIGMMDYMGASVDTKLPFADYYLQIPDRKASWTDESPTNVTGFIPEHSLGNLPRSKWIDHIVADLEKGR